VDVSTVSYAMKLANHYIGSLLTSLTEATPLQTYNFRVRIKIIFQHVFFFCLCVYKTLTLLKQQQQNIS